MHRRHTILETTAPVEANFQALIAGWASDHSVRLLGWVWRGIDALQQEVLSNVDWSQAEDDLEREMTELLEVRIRDRMPPGCPVYVQHEKKERESRSDPPAQPKEYDIAFVARANERVVWPLEVKVLRTDGRVADYVAKISSEFLTGSYAPFSSEAGMIGYLLAGEPCTAFANIASALATNLAQHPAFPQRPHQISNHHRSNGAFRCHHIIVRISKRSLGRHGLAINEPHHPFDII